jgi:hypothetical protein
MKELYVANSAPHVNASLANELRISRANPPAYGLIDERRRAVMERNKAGMGS